MARSGMIRVSLKSECSKICDFVAAMLIFLTFSCPVATRVGYAFTPAISGGAGEKSPVSVKNSVTTVNSGLEKLRHLIQEKLPDLDKVKARSRVLKDHITLMEQARKILKEGTVTCRESEHDVKNIKDQLSRSKGILSGADRIGFHDRILQIKFSVESVDNAVRRILESIKDLSLPKKTNVDNYMLGKVEQELRKIAAELYRQIEQTNSKDVADQAGIRLVTVKNMCTYVSELKSELANYSSLLERASKYKIDEVNYQLSGLHKLSSKSRRNITQLLTDFLRKNGRFITRRYIGKSLSVVEITVLGQNKGKRAVLVGGLFTGGEWTNDVVRNLALSTVTGQRVKIVQIHGLPQVTGRAVQFNFLERFKFEFYQKRPAELKVLRLLRELCRQGDLVICIGTEKEGGSSIYYASRKGGQPDHRIVRAFEKINLDKEFSSTLTKKCESVSLLNATNFDSMIGCLMQLFPGRHLYDVRICDRLPWFSKLKQARVILNHILVAYGIIDKGPKRIPVTNSLINIKDLTQDIVIDMKYATRDNVFRTKFYRCNECFLNKAIAFKLIRAQRYLEKRGLGLKCWDCYRPFHVQKAMWKIKPDRRYVANPNKKGSQHNRGVAVDVTLVDAKGKELEMPTAFDTFSEKASRDYRKLPDWQAENRDLLRKAMERSGFKGIRTEWWHFYGAPSKGYPIVDVPLTELE